MSLTYEAPNQEDNHYHPPTTSLVKLSLPRPMVSQHGTQGTTPTLHEDSSSSCLCLLASLTTDPSPSSPHHDENLGWPIALRK